MSDHITYNLVKEGYNTSKYIPFGPIKEMIPYQQEEPRETPPKVKHQGN